MLVLFNKPYGVLSQFTGEAHERTLAEFIDIADVYAAGRLDADSEGLLLLTDNGLLQAAIAGNRAVLQRLIGRKWRASQPTVKRLSLLAV